MEKKKKILIIDDYFIYYESVLELLKDQYDVCSAFDTYEAKRKLEDNHYDLAIIDIMLPLDGLDLDDLEKVDEYHTGLYFYDSYIRNKYPEMEIVFWSALKKSTIMNYFEEKGGKPQNVHIVKKELPPVGIKRKIDDIFHNK